eukprot:358965-Chlamydomonas_euryale.AAC.1
MAAGGSPGELHKVRKDSSRWHPKGSSGKGQAVGFNRQPYVGRVVGSRPLGPGGRGPMLPMVSTASKYNTTNNNRSSPLPWAGTMRSPIAPMRGRTPEHAPVVAGTSVDRRRSEFMPSD